MSCPLCGGTSTEINEIDQSLNCTTCGAVLENRSYYTEPTQHDRLNDREQTKEPSYKNIDWFMRIAKFFNLSDNLCNDGINLIKTHDSLLGKKYSKEIGMALVFLIYQHYRPAWSLDDFIKAFPIPLERSHVGNAVFLLKRKIEFSERSLSEQATIFIERIYADVVARVLGPNHVSKADIYINKKTLKEISIELIELGEDYSLNTGKRIRPVIAAATTIAALFLSVKNVKSTELKKKRLPKTFWSDQDSALTRHCFCRKETLYARFNEYYDLVSECVRNIPWLGIEMANQDSYKYLDDILLLFGRKQDEEGNLKNPLMKLNEFKTTPMLRREEKDQELERVIGVAKLNLDNEDGQEPEVRRIIKLLNNGYNEDAIRLWSRDYIQSIYASLLFRERFPRIDNENRDLDRQELREDDMNDEELEVYLRQYV